MTNTFRTCMADPLVVKLKKLHEAAIVPDYQSLQAACFDLHAVAPADWDEDNTWAQSSMWADDVGVFRTGLAVEIPPGWVMQIFSRSGHGFKSDVRLANCVGIIDSDYRGEIMVKLTADTNAKHFTVKPGDRIAQAMIIPIPRVQFEVVDELGTTARGTGGFGSTDRYADNPGADPFGSEGKHGWRTKGANPGIEWNDPGPTSDDL
jgi:dUTP pyrophosphatase